LQELTTDIRFACRSPTKTFGQQSGLVLHRARHLFIRQQTSVINAIRAHLAEFGIVAPVGRHVASSIAARFEIRRAPPASLVVSAS
jgi:transposase